MVSSYQGKLHELEKEKYPTVAEIMSRSFVTVTPDTDIYAAMDIILAKNASAALVVDPDHSNVLLGIVSEKDMLRLITQDSYENIPHGGGVINYMTPADKVVHARPDMGLNHVAELFINTPFKKVPVLENGKLVGIVRRWEVLSKISQIYKQNIEYLKVHNG
ncbi:CBS domain-containing protein [Acanthopleuribacter pedis]|uniref:CBS domain-containing protein n=1 Tax=Acanthopleuribacter pedis TaxID=442870 RepID=A0A8J7PZJ7_9BACT|nr:CBS domain-containing protein [Acanthopleuribacter pedis]MBO1317617.1 CBS domain-containing protein [Acanthopleuribacter pedis]